MNLQKITIYRDGVLAGEGELDKDGEIVNCAAILGADQDASDETYEAICDDIDREPQDAERYRGEGNIDRPDGTYSWVIRDCDPTARQEEDDPYDRDCYP